MTPRLKALWEACSPAFAVAGYPPIPRFEDDPWETHLRAHLFERLYAAGYSITENWRDPTELLAQTVARVYEAEATGRREAAALVRPPPHPEASAGH